MDDVIKLKLQAPRGFIPARTLLALAAVSAALSGIVIALGV